MIPPDLPECWHILALLEMKLDWPWREAGTENMEELEHGNLAIWHSRSLSADRSRMEVSKDYAMRHGVPQVTCHYSSKRSTSTHSI